MENQKIVAVWLTRAERGDEKIRERLRALRAEYKPKKYTVCEYHSGDGDLKQASSTCSSTTSCAPPSAR